MDLKLPGFEVVHASQRDIADRLVEILVQAHQINPEFLTGSQGYKARSNIEFDINWGLGSSSSLISNVAAWSGVDPFDLNHRVSKGSGYDIACARSRAPIVYWLDDRTPNYFESPFHPPFIHQLYFVYLEKKQDTNLSIEPFLKKPKPAAEWIDRISEITDQMRLAATIEEFNEGIRKHEKILSGILERPRLRDLYFSDFNGEVKSLGAWGGDFILVSSDQPEENLRDYFNKKDLYTIFPYGELIISHGIV